jgi:hypothetical protein
MMQRWDLQKMEPNFRLRLKSPVVSDANQEKVEIKLN